MEKIDQILESLYDRVIEPAEAKEQLLLLFGVINLVCLAPKGECDRKPEDVCKECTGCPFLRQTCL